MDFKEIERFAAEVRAALSHLSVEQIAHLTEGLEANVKASVDDGRGLPDVETYVKELLSGAGLDIDESAGTHGVVSWIRAFIKSLLNWFSGLNGQIRLLVGVVAGVALTVFTTDNWTIAVVVVAVNPEPPVEPELPVEIGAIEAAAEQPPARACPPLPQYQGVPEPSGQLPPK